MVQFYASFLNVYLGLISIKDYHLHPDRSAKVNVKSNLTSHKFLSFQEKRTVVKERKPSLL